MAVPSENLQIEIQIPHGTPQSVARRPVRRAPSDGSGALVADDGKVIKKQMDSCTAVLHRRAGIQFASQTGNPMFSSTPVTADAVGWV